MSKHTLGLPYYVSGTVGKDTFIQELNKDEDNYIGAIEGKQKAEYIVHCVNTHQALVDALEWALAYVRMPTLEPSEAEEFARDFNKAQEAFEKAKEREA